MQTSTAQIIDGKAIAAHIRAELADLTAGLAPERRRPGLAVVLVGDDPASAIYVRNKQRACDEVGIVSFSHTLAAETTQDALLDLIAQLNDDPAVDGILVQLPLPGQIDKDVILDAIDPGKDVDGFLPVTIGRLLLNQPALRACTPAGVMEILARESLPIAGRHAVVVGRSNIVGKPLAALLLNADATVTVCHSRTPDLPEHTRRADILIAAVGRPKLITADMVKPGAVVIDVGTNRTAEGKLVGDVDFAGVSAVAGWITPVPGGVGPMTIAKLLQNTWEAYQLHMARA